MQRTNSDSLNADGMEENALALYSCGVSQWDISEQIKELYDVEISPELIAKITERIMPEVTAWQNRPLEETYPFIFAPGLTALERVLWVTGVGKVCMDNLFANRFVFGTCCGREFLV